MTKTTIIVRNHRCLWPKARATRDLLHQPKQTRPTIPIHHKRPTIRRHRQPQKMSRILQIHPSRRKRKHPIYIYHPITKQLKHLRLINYNYLPPTCRIFRFIARQHLNASHFARLTLLFHPQQYATGNNVGRY